MLSATASAPEAEGQDISRNIPRPSPRQYHPFDAKMPVGANAFYAAQVRPPCPDDFQFVQFQVEGGGRARVYAYGPDEPVPASEDNRIGLAVGRVYRAVISDMPDFPGVELYPTVEIVDRTVPPPGREAEFPAPIRFSTEEIEIALSGRLVTKVLHVETPQFAAPAIPAGEIEVADFSPKANLLAEAVAGKAFHVGNVMIDTLKRHLPAARRRALHKGLELPKGGYLVGTFHRPSNVDHETSLLRLLETIEHASSAFPIVIPLHPRTRESLLRHGLMERLRNNPRVRLVEPLGYVDFLSLVDSSRAVLTDSGGIQEEATYLRIPCITMRENTERPATVECGSNVLAGTDPAVVCAEIDRLHGERIPKGSVPPLWDGEAAGRIVRIINQELR